MSAFKHISFEGKEKLYLVDDTSKLVGLELNIKLGDSIEFIDIKKDLIKFSKFNEDLKVELPSNNSIIFKNIFNALPISNTKNYTEDDDNTIYITFIDELDMEETFFINDQITMTKLVDNKFIDKNEIDADVLKLFEDELSFFDFETLNTDINHLATSNELSLSELIVEENINSLDDFLYVCNTNQNLTLQNSFNNVEYNISNFYLKHYFLDHFSDNTFI